MRNISYSDEVTEYTLMPDEEDDGDLSGVEPSSKRTLRTEAEFRTRVRKSTLLTGVFLFAALNVLEPLYEACLERMDGFIQDAARKTDSVSKTESVYAAFPDFRKMLDKVNHHPSRRYFIYKSIILHKLSGVDLMAEAMKICKLRLFLELVSQVDTGAALEPWAKANKKPGGLGRRAFLCLKRGLQKSNI